MGWKATTKAIVNRRDPYTSSPNGKCPHDERRAVVQQQTAAYLSEQISWLVILQEKISQRGKYFFLSVPDELLQHAHDIECKLL
jgi:hypothetical protein